MVYSRKLDPSLSILNKSTSSILQNSSPFSKSSSSKCVNSTKLMAEGVQIPKPSKIRFFCSGIRKESNVSVNQPPGNVVGRKDARAFPRHMNAGMAVQHRQKTRIIYLRL